MRHRRLIMEGQMRNSLSMGRLCFVALLCMLLSGLSIAEPINADQFVLQEWKIKKIYCPADCEPALKSALQAYLGAKISLGPNQFSGAMLENCDGPTELELKQQSRQEKIDELKQLIGEKFQAASLSLPKEVSSAIVYCQGTNGLAGAEGARILSIEKQRVLILYAEQVILELQK